MTPAFSQHLHSLRFFSFWKTAALLAGGLLLACCTGHPDEVRIKGDFTHLDQGEFYIYSSDEALDRLDTLRIEEGSFRYTLPTTESATLHILYPNFSELVVFAHPGDDISIKGDARNLSEVEVKGNDDNEQYTLFRKAVNGLGKKEATAAAKSCILEHAALPMARYLFDVYYLQDAKADAKEAKEVYDSLCRTNPESIELSRMATAVRAIGKTRPGNPLPDFKLELQPHHGDNGDTLRTICRDDYKDKYLLMVFWAGWKSGSQSGLYRARRTRREMEAKGKKLSLISYSLDVSENQLLDLEKRDSIDYPSYCDYLSMTSPLAQQWGITQLPFFIFVTPDGKIAASGSDWQKDMQNTFDKIE